jgi:FHA domain-containing protein
VSGATRLVAGALVRRALRGDGAPPIPHLLVRPPGGEERVVALPTELTVGRDPAADLVLADAGASRRHARLLLEDDGTAVVEDLGSKNGLRLNGRRLPPGRSTLRDGDELLVGATALRFVDPLAGPAGLDEPSGAMGSPGLPRAGAPSDDPGRGAWRAPPWGLLSAAAGLLGLSAALLLLG